MRAKFGSMRGDAYRRSSKAASSYGGVPNQRCVNELTAAQRERILRYVRTGMSFRSIERLTGHRRETISRYARDQGIEVGSRRLRAPMSWSPCRAPLPRE
jgi:DNA invertase Pin-like site-specific DNA recombinase